VGTRVKKKTNLFLLVAASLIMLIIISTILVLNLVKEQKYQDVLSMIKQKKWVDAQSNLDEISDYNNSGILKQYILANLELENNSTKLDTNKYEEALLYLNTIPQDYNGDYSKEIRELKKHLTTKIREIQLISTLMKKGEYQEAYNKILLSPFTKTDETFKVLASYNMALIFKSRGDLVQQLKILHLIPSNYKGIFSEEIKEEVEIITEMVSKQKEEAQTKAINSIVKFIEKGKYKEARRVEKPKKWEKNEVLQVLDNFSNALMYHSEGSINSMVDSLSNIPSSYNGVLSDQIKQYQKKYAKEIRKNREAERKYQEYLKKPEPQIGMAAEEVRNSRWGRPDRINRTTTKYGVHEQWVYSSFKYIYLENGVVTAIQD
jgi:hypothetical protein